MYLHQSWQFETCQHIDEIAELVYICSWQLIKREGFVKGDEPDSYKGAKLSGHQYGNAMGEVAIGK